VYHSKDDRIRSNVLLCGLALLLVRIAEVETGTTWPKIRREMQCLHIGEFLSKNTYSTTHRADPKSMEFDWIRDA
jgi:transposase